MTARPHPQDAAGRGRVSLILWLDSGVQTANTGCEIRVAWAPRGRVHPELPVRSRRTLGADRYTDAADYVAVANKAEADLAAARERHSGRYDLVGRLWNTEWGWHERREWLGRRAEVTLR